ncbi:MAG: molecular chaperone TorD family protein [Candidatus Binatia bacterium]
MKTVAELPALCLDDLPAAGKTAAARSALYQLLLGMLAYPTVDLCTAVQDGRCEKAVRTCLAHVPCDLTWTGAGFSDTLAQLEVDYTRLFLVDPCCPLRETAYSFARQNVWEELLRFYEFFGLRLVLSEDQLPDHLCVQLGFLHFLTFREAECAGGGAAIDFARAERDFLARHVCRWVPKAAEGLRASLQREKVNVTGGISFYSSVMDLVQDFVSADREYLERSVPS